MKFNFKKISAIASSILMTGMTMGIAAAASFPAPFDAGSTSTNAVVYGASAASTDVAAVTSINEYLKSKVASDIGTPEGESFLFEKTSTKLQIGDALHNITATSLDADNLPILLAGGEFVDDDNDEFTFTQEIKPANLRLTMFDDSDYARDAPTLGFRIANNGRALNYTLDFVDTPYWDDLATSNMVFMGKEYYISSITNGTSATSGTLNLLDTANTVTMAEGDEQTVSVGDKSYVISIYSLTTSEVRLKVDGDLTNSLSVGQTQRLSDGSYLGVKDIFQRDVSGIIGTVEFSIGSGKLVLTHDADIKLNDVTLSGLKTYITNDGITGKLDKIVLDWVVDKDKFVTPDSELAMPGFESVKYTFTGVEYPVEEAIELEAGSNDYIQLREFPLESGVASIPIAYFNGSNYNAIGTDNENWLRTAQTNTITFNDTSDEQFILTWTDAISAESYLLKASVREDSSAWKNYTTVSLWEDSGWVSKGEKASSASKTYTFGSAEMTVGAVHDDDNTVVFTVLGNNNFHDLYSKEGMRVQLPTINDTTVTLATTTNYSAVGACSTAAAAINVIDRRVIYTGKVVYSATSGIIGENSSCYAGYGPTTLLLNFTEEDKNENVDDGSSIVATLTDNTVNEASIETVTHEQASATRAEIGTSDKSRSFTYSPLATEVLEDESGDRESVLLTYHGSEVFGKMYLTGASSSVSESGSMIFKDSEKTSWQSRDAILIGGSCINSAVADLLGGALCEAEFTAETGVDAGQFLIASYDGFASGKVALVVAGYNAADTAMAADTLIGGTETIDTAVGKSYLGTTAASEGSVLAAM